MERKIARTGAYGGITEPSNGERLMTALVWGLSLAIAGTNLVSSVAAAPPGMAQLDIAEDAMRGVIPADRAYPRPKGTHVSLVRRERCGPYNVFPEVRPRGDGTETVVYFTAVRRSTKRADFIVGPAELEAFRARACAAGSNGSDAPSKI